MPATVLEEQEACLGGEECVLQSPPSMPAIVVVDDDADSTAALKATIAARDATIAERDATIAERDAAVAELPKRLTEAQGNKRRR